ncbi:MAG: hypothetical protein Q4P15_09215 [Propionibacteriaceae bacterium]|nr:hypothetical protein [Propionibacteriaceae bacterium]
MPTASEAPSFEALSMQSVLSRARDDSRFAAPEGAPEEENRRTALSIRGLLYLAVGILVLGVTAGALWVNINRDDGVDETTIVKPKESEEAEIRTPQQAVRGYLEALARGDIEEALTFGPLGGEEGSKALLTSEAYAATPPEFRPSNIRIATDDVLATEVNVTYALAGQDVSTAIRLTRSDSGSYRLARTTVTIRMEMVGGDNLPVLLNGVPVKHQLPLEVVPGMYVPSTGLTYVTFPVSSNITILSLAYDDTATFTISPELNGDGQSAFQKAAQASLERCIASRELTPTGCPNGIVAPKPVKPGSVKWKLGNPSSAFSDFRPSLSSLDQTVAVATVTLRLQASLDYTSGQTGDSDETLIFGVSAPMLGGDDVAIPVTWER